MYTRIEKKTGKIRYCEEFLDPLTNKWRTASVTFDCDNARNRKEAFAILRQKINSMLQPEVVNVSLSQLIAEYKKDHANIWRRSSYDRVNTLLSFIESTLGGTVIVDKLSARYIKNKFLSTGRSASTLNSYIKRFKTLIRWAFKNDFINSTNSINKLDFFPDDKKDKNINEKFLEREELHLLINDMHEPIWALLTEFLALSGLRCGEAIALNKKDVDLKNFVIHVTKNYDSNNKIIGPTKNINSCDDVVIQPQLADVIRRINLFIQRQQIEYGYRSSKFFSNKNGGYLSYHAYFAYFKDHSIKSIGRPLSPHSLRHTHASLLFEAGFSLDEVSRRLRHGNSKITHDVYIHVTKKLKEKDAEKIRAVNLL